MARQARIPGHKVYVEGHKRNIKTYGEEYIPITIHQTHLVHVSELEKLFPRMKQIHNLSEKEGIELAVPIIYHNGKLIFEEGFLGRQIFPGTASSVQSIEFNNEIGLFHTHPNDTAFLSYGDFKDSLDRNQLYHYQCVSSDEAVGCYIIKTTKNGELTKVIRDIVELTLAGKIDEAELLYYTSNYESMWEIVGSDVTPRKDLYRYKMVDGKEKKIPGGFTLYKEKGKPVLFSSTKEAEAFVKKNNKKKFKDLEVYSHAPVQGKHYIYSREFPEEEEE